MNQQLFQTLGQTAGMYIPLYPDQGDQQNKRHSDRSKAAEFGEYMLGKPADAGEAKPAQGGAGAASGGKKQ